LIDADAVGGKVTMNNHLMFSSASDEAMTPECPKCGNTQIEEVITGRRREYYCPTCSHSWPVPPVPR
jgi:predicted RNA-binding Zn-ribbon protein involved in translation (DUF1610 family)